MILLLLIILCVLQALHCTFFPLRKQYGSKIKAGTSAKIYILATMYIFAEVPHYIDCIVPLCQTSEIANNARPI